MPGQANYSAFAPSSASFLQMSRTQLSIRCAVFAVGLAGLVFATQRYIWFASLPASSFALRCGNCRMIAVGVPLELGALGLLLMGASALGVSYPLRQIGMFSVLVLGVLATPMMIGVPLFIFAFTKLSVPVVAAIYRHAYRHAVVVCRVALYGSGRK